MTVITSQNSVSCISCLWRGHFKRIGKLLDRKKADMVKRIEILKTGDEVLNVWSNNLTECVAVKHKNGDVSIYSISHDEQGIPRVDKKDTLIITKGNGEVTTEILVTSYELSDDAQENGVDSTVQITSF